MYLIYKSNKVSNVYQQLLISFLRTGKTWQAIHFVNWIKNSLALSRFMIGMRIY